METEQHTQAPDQELVQAAQAGELEAFEELVYRHERPVYALAHRMLLNEQDAEDITQQTFLEAMRHLGEFRGEASFGTWLRRIATHAALKIIRKRNRVPVASFESGTHADDNDGPLPHPEWITDWATSPAELAQRRETRQLIEQALSALADKHRLVFLLRDVEGFSVKETAQALGLSEVNVKVRLLRARLELRERLTRDFGDPGRRLEPGHRHSSEAQTNPDSSHARGPTRVEPAWRAHS